MKTSAENKNNQPPSFPPNAQLIYSRKCLRLYNKICYQTGNGKSPFLSEGRGRITSHSYRDRKFAHQDPNQAQRTTVVWAALFWNTGTNLAALESSHLVKGKASILCSNANQNRVPQLS